MYHDKGDIAKCSFKSHGIYCTENDLSALPSTIFDCVNQEHTCYIEAEWCIYGLVK